MDFFWRREADFAKALSAYLEKVRGCAEATVNAFEVLLTEGVSERFEELEREVSDYESAADTLRRELEHRLYRGAFLADSRGDFLGLLEALDKMPNSMETLVRDAAIMGVEIPPRFAGDVRELVDTCAKAVEEACAATGFLFSDVNETLQRAKHVDHLETDGDEIEMNLLRQVFASELDLAHKMLLKDIIRDLARIADRAENACDRIEIIAIKRKA
jgi:hypothetical protein